MLYNEHCKAGKELQRKIDKLKEEGKDPSLPQLPELSQKVPPPKPTYHGSPRVNTSSPQPLRFMTDSQNTGDESFMLLGGQRVRLSLSPMRSLNSGTFLVRSRRRIQPVLEYHARNVR